METRGRPKKPDSQKVIRKMISLNPSIFKLMKLKAKKAKKSFSKYISDLAEGVE